MKEKGVKHYQYYFVIVAREGKCPRHVLVAYKGRYFVFDGLDANDEPLSVPEFNHQFTHIIENYKDKPFGAGIGALTAENRTTWARVNSNRFFSILLQNLVIGVGSHENINLLITSFSCVS